MKLYNVLPVVLSAAVLLTPAAALAQEGRACSNELVAGDWGYLKTGTVSLPSGPAGFAAVGRITLRGDGGLSGTQDANIGGNAAKGELRGTYTVNADCTSSMTVDVVDPASGSLLRTVLMAVVFDDKAMELRGIVTRLTLPNGVSLPQVITGSARRVFPDHNCPLTDDDGGGHEGRWHPRAFRHTGER